MDSIPHTAAQQSYGVYDAVLLADDTGASRKVFGGNKSFLEINGIPLFIYVLRALQQAELINRICIVGPGEQIVQALKDPHDV